jgi:hypothetical protein
LREKTLLVGVRELIRRIDFFFLDSSVCEHPWKNLKLNGGIGFLQAIQKFKKMLLKKAPPLKFLKNKIYFSKFDNSFLIYEEYVK